METPSIAVDSLGAWTQMALTSRCHMSVPLTKVHRSLRILDQRPNGAPTRDVQEQAADLLRLTKPIERSGCPALDRLKVGISMRPIRVPKLDAEYVDEERTISRVESRTQPNRQVRGVAWRASRWSYSRLSG